MKNFTLLNYTGLLLILFGIFGLTGSVLDLGITGAAFSRLNDVGAPAFGIISQTVISLIFSILEIGVGLSVYSKKPKAWFWGIILMIAEAAVVVGGNSLVYHNRFLQVGGGGFNWWGLLLTVALPIIFIILLYLGRNDR